MSLQGVVLRGKFSSQLHCARGNHLRGPTHVARFHLARDVQLVTRLHSGFLQWYITVLPFSLLEPPSKCLNYI